MVTATLSPAELNRLSLRIALLVFNRGLTHLPQGCLPDELIDELKSGIRDAHDFLVSGAQTRVVSMIVATRLSSLRERGFDPFTLYTHAFAPSRGKRRQGYCVPIEHEGTVIEFPAPARAFIQSANILRSAAEDRRRLYRSAVAEIERLAFNAHLIVGKPERLFHPARDFAHHGETFLANSRLVGCELVWDRSGPAVEGYEPILSEGEFIKRHTAAVALLDEHGVHLGSGVPPVTKSSRGRKTPSKGRR